MLTGARSLRPVDGAGAGAGTGARRRRPDWGAGAYNAPTLITSSAVDSA